MKRKPTLQNVFKTTKPSRTAKTLKDGTYVWSDLTPTQRRWFAKMHNALSVGSLSTSDPYCYVGPSDDGGDWLKAWRWIEGLAPFTVSISKGLLVLTPQYSGPRRRSSKSMKSLHGERCYLGSKVTLPEDMIVAVFEHDA